MLEAVAPFLRKNQVDPVPLQSLFKRVRSRPLSETIENWSEISNALRGTPYEWFLEDDLELR